MFIHCAAGAAHANKFGKEGGACFNLEFGAAWGERISALAPMLEAPALDPNFQVLRWTPEYRAAVAAPSSKQ